METMSPENVGLIAVITYALTAIQFRILKAKKIDLTPEAKDKWGKTIAIWSGIIATTIAYYTGMVQTDIIRIVFEGINATLIAIGSHNLILKWVLGRAEKEIRNKLG